MWKLTLRRFSTSVKKWELLAPKYKSNHGLDQISSLQEAEELMHRIGWENMETKAQTSIFFKYIKEGIPIPPEIRILGENHGDPAVSYLNLRILISMDVDEALSYFNRLNIEKVANIRHFNAMMEALFRYGRPNDAFQLYSMINSLEYLPNKYSFQLLIRNCINLKMIQSGLLYYQQLLDFGLEIDQQMSSLILRLLSHTDPDKAVEYFNSIVHKDCSSFVEIMRLFVHLKDYATALKYHSDMQSAGFSDTEDTVVYLIICSVALNQNMAEIMELYDMVFSKELAKYKATGRINQRLKPLYKTLFIHLQQYPDTLLTFYKHVFELGIDPFLYIDYVVSSVCKNYQKTNPKLIGRWLKRVEKNRLPLTKSTFNQSLMALIGTHGYHVLKPFLKTQKDFGNIPTINQLDLITKVFCNKIPLDNEFFEYLLDFPWKDSTYKRVLWKFRNDNDKSLEIHKKYQEQCQSEGLCRKYSTLEQIE